MLHYRKVSYLEQLIYILKGVIKNAKDKRRNQNTASKDVHTEKRAKREHS